MNLIISNGPSENGILPKEMRVTFVGLKTHGADSKTGFSAIRQISMFHPSFDTATVAWDEENK